MDELKNFVFKVHQKVYNEPITVDDINLIYTLAMKIFNINESNAICRMVSDKDISYKDIISNINFMHEYNLRFDGDDKTYINWIETL